MRLPGRVLAPAAAALLFTARSSALSLDRIEYIFSFGDSFTYDGFRPALGLNPVVGQTLSTTTGSWNWFEYLAASTKASNSWWDFAQLGASTDNAIIPSVDILAGGHTLIPSLVEQVQTFKQYFTKNLTWVPAETLFTLFFGINDLGLSDKFGLSYPNIMPSILKSYSEQFGILYASGARRFLIMNVPAMDQTPIYQGYGPAVQAVQRSNILLWNDAIAAFAADVPNLFPGATVTFFDTHSLFSALLASPTSYGFAASVAGKFCEGYQAVVNYASINLPECGVPLSEYFWHDNYHPTFTVHKLLAEGIEEALLAAPARKARRSRGHRIFSW